MCGEERRKGGEGQGGGGAEGCSRVDGPGGFPAEMFFTLKEREKRVEGSTLSPPEKGDDSSPPEAQETKECPSSHRYPINFDLTAYIFYDCLLNSVLFVLLMLWTCLSLPSPTSNKPWEQRYPLGGGGSQEILGIRPPGANPDRLQIGAKRHSVWIITHGAYDSQKLSSAA